MRAPAWLAWLALAVELLAGSAHARAELLTFQAYRTEQGLQIDFGVRAALPAVVEEALLRGMPVYFVADARVYRRRWYWRDKRVVRATRTWRLSYQPLTSTWRVSQGGLHQSYASLAEALAPLTRVTRWKVAEPTQLEPDERHYIDFQWRLDTSQLPRPMQIGIGADWQLGVEGTLRLE